MKIKNKTKTALVSALTMLCVSSGLNAQSVNFDLTYGSNSETYKNVTSGDVISTDIIVVPFEVDIQKIDNVPVSFDSAFAAFCIEIGETISEGNFTYQYDNLAGISSGNAGLLGSATSAIPIGGIGDLAAARVKALFDNHYQSADLSDWGFSEASPLSHAFQLAVWEISHDGDLSLSDTSGAFYIGRQGRDNDLQNNAIELAQKWLDEISTVSTSYQSQSWNVTAIESNGRPGYQDLVFATPVPEPSSALLLSLGGLASLTYRKRK